MSVPAMKHEVDLLGVPTSLAADDGVVTAASRSSIAVMAMGEDTMVVLNPEAIEPTR